MDPNQVLTCQRESFSAADCQDLLSACDCVGRPQRPGGRMVSPIVFTGHLLESPPTATSFKIHFVDPFYNVSYFSAIIEICSDSRPVKRHQFVLSCRKRQWIGTWPTSGSVEGHTEPSWVLSANMLILKWTPCALVDHMFLTTNIRGGATRSESLLHLVPRRVNATCTHSVILISHSKQSRTWQRWLNENVFIWWFPSRFSSTLTQQLVRASCRHWAVRCRHGFFNASRW